MEFRIINCIHLLDKFVCVIGTGNDQSYSHLPNKHLMLSIYAFVKHQECLLHLFPTQIKIYIGVNGLDLAIDKINLLELMTLEKKLLEQLSQITIMCDYFQSSHGQIMPANQRAKILFKIFQSLMTNSLDTVITQIKKEDIDVENQCFAVEEFKNGNDLCRPSTNSSNDRVQTNIYKNVTAYDIIPMIGIFN
ncbi:hypothetical protein X798_00239 [Onchocerca flexuosa]|uniref:Uncharacterized protein n=1 Tax=Onchocerca flexuosa TaxID=387005 RepID=A0A238C6K2_9BILA|nr:hypothetical protein X798_00239 [Onchocerca flexuosa]